MLLLISLEELHYGPDQPVPLAVTLLNPGDSAVFVNARLALNTPFAPALFREVTLQIARTGAEALPFDARINIGAPREGDFRLLLPGEQVEKRYQLRNYYDLQPGTYSVQAVYQNRQGFEQGDARAWQGEIVSDAITFTIGSV